MSLREINLFHTSMEERQAALAMNCAGSVEDDMCLMLGTLTYLFPFSLPNLYLSRPRTGGVGHHMYCG